MSRGKGVWNRAARRSGGDRKAKIMLPPISKDDAQIIMQREKIRAEFGEAGVKRFDEELERKAQITKTEKLNERRAR